MLGLKPGLLGEKRVCYLYAMQPPMTAIFKILLLDCRDVKQCVEVERASRGCVDRPMSRPSRPARESWRRRKDPERNLQQCQHQVFLFCRFWNFRVYFCCHKRFDILFISIIRFLRPGNFCFSCLDLNFKFKLSFLLFRVAINIKNLLESKK